MEQKHSYVWMAFYVYFITSTTSPSTTKGDFLQEDVTTKNGCYLLIPTRIKQTKYFVINYEDSWKNKTTVNPLTTRKYLPTYPKAFFMVFKEEAYSYLSY